MRNKQRVKHLEHLQNVKIYDLPIVKENIEQLTSSLDGVQSVYYLIHSVNEPKIGNKNRDLYMANIIAKASKNANVTNIIYLGGLGTQQPNKKLSPHLQIRQAVANILRKSRLNVTELRAGIIIGPGSASFNIIHSLGQKLPFLPIHNYYNGLCSPIDIDDVIRYLIKAKDDERYQNTIIEIGVNERYSYNEIILAYTKFVLKKELIVIDNIILKTLLTKPLIARIIAYLSSIPFILTAPLINSLDSLAIKDQYDVERFDTSIKPIPLISSLIKAHDAEKLRRVESFWSIPDSHQVLSTKKEEFLHIERGETKKDIIKKYKDAHLLYEIKERIIKPEMVDVIFHEIKKVGGKYGYWSPYWLWRIRAFADKLIGGPGLDIGRKTDLKNIRIGERIDFWIVSAYLDTHEKKVLTLKGRIRSPGDSWLQFVLLEDGDNWRFTVRAFFNPRGILGYLYWYSLFFVHKYIFDVMIDNIIKKVGDPR